MMNSEKPSKIKRIGLAAAAVAGFTTLAAVSTSPFWMPIFQQYIKTEQERPFVDLNNALDKTSYALEKLDESATSLKELLDEQSASMERAPIDYQYFSSTRHNQEDALNGLLELAEKYHLGKNHPVDGLTGIEGLTYKARSNSILLSLRIKNFFDAAEYIRKLQEVDTKYHTKYAEDFRKLWLLGPKK